ncbi:UxaA family hydrolase [Varunaivibrio sulfuroxidans]|uniref:(2R)-sulfolactate sulfo-lyase subunit alpha n=1 Tax=Varunaivibrio sulfuroxidans TaxID=1773489 RepID=A0A4R3JBR3_9PROT|nr:UxaA family hydrolase [Varunaivibrio sulfuroxidans]TCS63084.1 (2R)-sulfolactate sulfo-lyase subunit alpha [Varunaivibrio sulfuroxidans]WES31844.1 UxaA family hydrolase [Varunaivibrio sulfuroxidans]
MPAPQFIVHDAKDTVGVVVVEGVKKGAALDGWVMENDSRIAIAAAEDIPLGHKIALGEIKKGETVLKYGHDIGKAVADIPAGAHAHVHNVKTKKW